MSINSDPDRAGWVWRARSAAYSAILCLSLLRSGPPQRSEAMRAQRSGGGPDFEAPESLQRIL